LGSPIEMAGQWSPLQQCCATAQPVIPAVSQASLHMLRTDQRLQ